MSPQSLPNEFKENVRNACQNQGLDYDEVIDSLSQLVNGEFLNSNIWEGPGPDIPTLALDINVITPNGLFSHEVHSDGLSATGITFLDTISQNFLLTVNEETAKYALAISKYEVERLTRVFGNDQALQMLRDFGRTLIRARDESVDRHLNSRGQGGI